MDSTNKKRGIITEFDIWLHRQHQCSAPQCWFLLCTCSCLALTVHLVTICKGCFHTWLVWSSCFETGSIYLQRLVHLGMCEHSNRTWMRDKTRGIAKNGSVACFQSNPGAAHLQGECDQLSRPKQLTVSL